MTCARIAPPKAEEGRYDLLKGEMMTMMKTTTLALSAALVLGSASTALAQFYAPDVDVGPYEPGPAYVTPYAAPYAGPYGYRGDTWWTNRRALQQRRGMGDTNGF